ncbi:hypothetical protein ACMFMF_000448 [Clarireedia jacksonii]
MASYDTQQKLIAEKAQEKGIAPSVILDCFREKLSQVYTANPHCAEAWARARTEYLVWDHFFPEDLFPGKIMTEARTTNPESSSSEDTGGVSTKVDPPQPSRIKMEPGEVLETHEVSNLPPRPLNIQERLIAAASSCGIRARDVQYSFGQQLSYIKDRYPRESLQWQQWLAGSKVWEAKCKHNQLPSRNIQAKRQKVPEKGAFPFPEPARSYALLSSHVSSFPLRPPTGPPNKDVLKSSDGRSVGDKGTRGSSRRTGSRSRSPVISRKSGSERDSRRHRSRSRERYANKYTSRSEGNRRSIRRALPVSSSGNGGGSAVGSDPKIVSTTGLCPIKPPGYRTNEATMEKHAISLNCRREFFVCLQKNRDIARNEHRDCDPTYRGWLADLLTWHKMFEGPFPWLSEEPVVKHSNTCLKSKTRTGNSSMNMISAHSVENDSLMGLPERISNQISSIPSDNHGVMKVNNPTSLVYYAKGIDTFAIKTALYQPTIRVNNKKIPCPGKFGLLCEVFSREIRSDTSVQTELGCAMYFGAKMENIDLYSLTLGGFSVDRSSKENLVLQKADAFLEAWATECVNGSISLTDCWRKYKARSGAPLGDLDMDVDSLLKEEAAKVEGASRKVFDEHSGKVVPLKDYEIMIKTRLLKAAHEATSTPATNSGVLRDISSGQGPTGEC